MLLPSFPLLLASLPLAWLAASTPAVAQARPHVIFIMADDLGYGDLGSFGQTNILTPVLDQMATEGLRFTQAYSGAPICAPARSTLLTGQHTGRTRVRGNFGSPGFGVQDDAGNWRVPLAPEDVTLAEVLQSAGYVTGATGKWGLGEEDTSGLPQLQGFDEWYGLLNQAQAHSYYPTFVWRGQAKEFLVGNTGTTQNFATQAHYVHDLFTDFALDFVDRHAPGDAPFFLYLPYTIPHDAFQIPELEPYAAAAAGWTQQQRVYASMITRMDRDIGRLLDRLRHHGIENNTLVFFCSDNGAANRYDGRFNSSANLRGRKRDVYDGGLRTAMLARWPGQIAANTVSDAIWYLPDVLPTLAELAGVPAPAVVDGISIAPTLLGHAQPALAARPLYWEFHEGQFAQAIRRGPWKAVRQNPDQPTELYDLTIDPGETTNRASQQAALVSEMEGLFRTLRTPSPIWPTALDAPLPTPGGAGFGGWLPLDTTRGTTAADASDQGGDAILQNFATSGWSSDATGRYLSFSGSQRHLRVTGQTPPAGASPRSFATWLRTSQPGVLAAWGNRSGPGLGWVVRLDTSTGALRVEVGGGYVLGTMSLTNGQWQHAAVVFDPDTDGSQVTGVRLYVNGVAQTISASLSQTVNTAPGTTFWIGAEAERADLDYTGDLRHVQWWDRALSPAAITTLAESALTPSTRWFQSHRPGAALDWAIPDPVSGYPLLFHYASGTAPGARLEDPIRLHPVDPNRLYLSAARPLDGRVLIVPEVATQLAGPWLDGGAVFSAEPDVGGRPSWRSQPLGDSPLFARLRYRLPAPK